MNGTEQEEKGLDQIHSSNNENYDKAILTLSSTGFMFSVAIINFIDGKVVGLSCVYGAWLCFILAISVNLISFITGNKATEHEKPRDNNYAKLTKWLNILAGILLILAFIMVAIFAGLNIN